jgi:hypothetical protein
VYSKNNKHFFESEYHVTSMFLFTNWCTRELL